MMWKNLLMQFVKKGLYALVAMLIAILVKGMADFHPDGVTEKVLWEYLLYPALVGLVALLKRLLTWDPKKV